MAEEQKPSPPSRVAIPMWVGLAGLVVALIVGVIIIANVLRPLVNLVFPTEAKPPVPANVIELQHIPDPRTSDGEWLYATEQDGCAIAAFYVSQGSQCQLAPFVCVADQGEAETIFQRDQLTQIGTCRGSKGGVMDSYSWEVLISSGYSDYTTKFRVYLYRER